jgi:hypothetical protein
MDTYLGPPNQIPDVNKEAVLQIVFKAINDSIGPNGLIPTLLVYSAYPRITQSDTQLPSVTQRAAVIKKAIIEINKLRAKR